MLGSMDMCSYMVTLIGPMWINAEVNTRAPWLSSSLNFFEIPLPNLGLMVYRTHIHMPRFTTVVSSFLVLLFILRHIKVASLLGEYILWLSEVQNHHQGLKLQI